MPEQSIQIIIASLNDNTLKQYNTALKKWWEFCNSKRRDPFNSDIPPIVEFLSIEFANGAKYGTLNSIRSAISLIIGPEIAEDHRMKRFFRGVSNLRPANPKYDTTWCPSKVLSYFSNQVENSQLDLKDLSKKVITLLALVTAHRMQTFSLIDINNIEIGSDKVVIKIPDRIKTSGLNREQPILIIPMFLENCKVCAGSALVSYLQRTRHNRNSEKRLFLSYKSPYKAVSSQTLSRWVSDILSLAGIDTSVFSAHSTRHAATSAAKRDGISLALIRKTAGWSKNSLTFAKFYDRDIVEEKESFAEAIYRKQRMVS